MSRLNVFFCLLVIAIHLLSEPVTVLDRQSWQFAVVIVAQRLAMAAVPGFFFLSGVKLTLPRRTAPPLGAYWLGRARTLLAPYLLAFVAYYGYFAARGQVALSAGSFLGYLLRGDLAAHFYFLYPLFQFILLTPLFRRLAEGPPEILVPAALGITVLSSATFFLAVFPGVSFPYFDRLFTTYVAYYLTGCCVGARYEAALAFLRKNERLIVGVAVFFAAADGILSWVFESRSQWTPYLPQLDALYWLSAPVCLLTLAARYRERPLSPLAGRIDRASYLIYLYHMGVLMGADALAGKLGLAGTLPRLLFRVPVTFGVTIAGCVLWQELWRRVKNLQRTT